MKKNLVLTALLAVSTLLPGCSKKNNSSATSLSFETPTASVIFPVSFAAVQVVDTLQTTLIAGQFSDTSTSLENISIRVLGDTSLTYKGNSVLVTYTDVAGNTYNSSGDSTDYVTISQFPKADEALVTGSFSVTVTGSNGTLLLNNGHFTASFQD